MNTIINGMGEALAGAVSTVFVFAFALSAYLVLKLVFGAFRKCGDPTLPVPIFLVLAGWGCLVRMIVSLTASWSPVSTDDFLDVAVVLIAVCPISEILAGSFVFASVRCLLPKVDLRKIRRMPAGRPYRRSGWSLFVAAILTAIGNLLTACFLICSARGVVREREPFGVVLIVIFGALVQCPVVIWIFRKACAYFRYAKICNESDRTLAALGIRRAPILLLRSFKLDVVVGGMSFDEYVCGEFADADAPILSLCDPDEDVPSGGSIKIQAMDERWKELILKLIPSCRAIVMYEGVTNGLQWEIGTVRKLVDPSRFFVASPPVRYRVSAWYGCGGGTIGFHRMFSRKGIRMMYGFVWSRFKAKMEQSKITIPECPIPDESLVSFASGWNDPQVVKCNARSGVIGKVLELTREVESAARDYSEMAAAIAEFERQSKLPEDFGGHVRRVRSFALWSMILAPAMFLLLCLFAFAAGYGYAEERLSGDEIRTTVANEDVELSVERILQLNDIKYEKKVGSGCAAYSFLVRDDDDNLMSYLIVLNPLLVHQIVTVSAEDERYRKRLLGFANCFNNDAAPWDFDIWLTVNEDADALDMKRMVSYSDFVAMDQDDRVTWLLIDPIGRAKRIRAGVAKLVDEKVSFADAVRAACDFEADADRSEADDEGASE